jgi:hypothetical protein
VKFSYLGSPCSLLSYDRSPVIQQLFPVDFDIIYQDKVLDRNCAEKCSVFERAGLTIAPHWPELTCPNCGNGPLVVYDGELSIGGFFQYMQKVTTTHSHTSGRRGCASILTLPSTFPILTVAFCSSISQQKNNYDIQCRYYGVSGEFRNEALSDSLLCRLQIHPSCW